MYIPYPKIEEQIEIGQELSNDSELQEIESQILKITSGFLDLEKVKIYE
jgi:restriction endonuclease S subunit